MIYNIKMPNYIYNKLVLQGDWETIKKIIGSDRKTSIKNGQRSKSYKKFKFDIIAPVDTKLEYDKTFDPHYHCVQAWGTKWQPWDVTLIKEPEQVILKFTTAWDPPINWINKLHEIYPNIKFNLAWADEDFPSCGSIFANPIELKPPIVKNFKFNSDDAVQFVKDNFEKLYLKNITNYNSFMMLKKINEQLDMSINKIYNEKIKLECDEYDKNNNPSKYKFTDIKNLDLREKIIIESYEISKKVFVENKVKININKNFDMIIEL